ncbi:ABC transporter substrate-binding protein [Noviherbaspirillum sp. UKPF54]|uniref:ABC transporter substrate-binding protein n=1 Tax=Noviherbaspirillum sp. UKPF54 TaxID=2601898 RepID=UPI0011B1AE25|nr:ABC transporter substrate-binding protein [Noviherbaspirillum sp. UKPF54]QDZ29717.1 ABC transporter substrate-binding protein [Noviherbaspirillum sp. UKPF54]
MISKHIIARAFAAAFAAVAIQASAQAPAGYPADYAKIVDAAKHEGKLVVYAATDTKAAEPLIKDFNALYPDIKVEYNDMNSTEIYNRYISEIAAGGATADVLWSSAMDLQIKLVNDGYGLQYKSPELAALPFWASMNNTAYGTTFEPAVFVYNKRQVTGDEIPQTHADFARLLTTKTDKFKDKVITYDIEKSGVGFMFITQDLRVNDKFWDLAKALGTASVRVQSSTGTMLERVSSGENLLGYNVMGSYALVRAKKDPNLGVVIPKDYTLVLSRVQFISKSTKHPNAAKLWIDYLLSKRGQTIISNDSKLYAIRSDVHGETSSVELSKEIGNGLKPLQVNVMMLQYMDQAKRLAFLKQWKEAMAKK